MSLILTDFLANQLRSIAAPDVDWQMGNVDRAAELSAILARNNITDIVALRVEPVAWQEIIPAHYRELSGDAGGQMWVDEQIIDHKSYRFNYHGRPIGYMGTPDVPAADQVFEQSRHGYFCAWSAAGRGHVGYHVRPRKVDPRTIEIVPIWDSSSDTGMIRDTLLQMAQFVAFVALPIGGISLGAQLGASVLGPAVAAAYPTVTAALGNAALSAVFSGGDVEGAAKNAVLSVVGAGAGGAVASQVSAFTSSPWFGAAVGAATRAVVAGGDPKRAVLTTLIAKGGTMFSIDEDTGEFLADPGFDLGADDLGIVGSAGDEFGDLYVTGDDFGGGDFVAYSQPGGSSSWEGLDITGSWSGSGTIFDSPALPDWDVPLTDPDGIWNFTPTFDAGGATFIPLTVTNTSIPNGNSPAYPRESSAYTPTQVVQGVTAAAMAAIQLVAAYRNLQNPQIQTTARAVRSDGAVSVIGSNGLIQTRHPDGRVTYSRPPVGIPQATVDGSYVLNNGNGTYALISSTGQSQTLPYSAPQADPAPGGQVIPGISNGLLFVGGAVALMLAMRK